jgi:hypothetical protein
MSEALNQSVLCREYCNGPDVTCSVVLACGRTGYMKHFLGRLHHLLFKAKASNVSDARGMECYDKHLRERFVDHLRAFLWDRSVAVRRLMHSYLYAAPSH